MADSPEQPKIIIDSDWKAQAQREKEKLAQKEREAQEKAKSAAPTRAAAAGQAGPGGDEEGMPAADFSSLVGTLISQALLYMGGFPDPQTGRAIVSLEHAKFHIDLLAVLEEKTKGNLTPEEAKDLTLTLSELRMRFVEIAKAVAQAAKEGRVSRVGPGGAMGAGSGAGGGVGGVGGMPGGSMSGISGPGF